MLMPEDTRIQTLGSCDVSSPIRLSEVHGDGVVNFVSDELMPYRVERRRDQADSADVLFEKAGPRNRLFFDPAETRAAIVTCGGLCPGLNNVIRSAVLQLHFGYGVRSVTGIRYGYAGLSPERKHEPIELTPAAVENVHLHGGTVLGSSRGPIDPGVAVEFLRDREINILLCIGGDGTQKGAHRIATEAQAQGYPLSVVGIPKTIDNDIPFVWQTFGFNTAVETAREVIKCAHTEARCAPGGVVVVKLMGRDAGFLAAAAAVASQDVNFVLVPEMPFRLEGETGLLALLEKRVAERDHAVVVVAEGAGQDLMPEGQTHRDASGNVLHKDIGPFLTASIQAHFRRREFPANVRYIDPSYVIRSVPANCDDAQLCDRFARNAIHAAMSGRTDLLIGRWYNVFIHVPLPLATERKKQMSPESELWRSVVVTTGQPLRIGQSDAVDLPPSPSAPEAPTRRPAWRNGPVRQEASR